MRFEPKMRDRSRRGHALVIPVLISTLIISLPLFAAEPEGGSTSAATRKLTGRVVADHTGEAIAGAVITVVELKRRTESDRTGTFHLTDLTVGELTLKVRATGFASVQSTVRLPLTDALTIRLKLKHRFHGEVVVAGGREIPASTVILGREVDTPENRMLDDVLKAIPNILDNSGGRGRPTIRGIDGAAVSEFNENMHTGNRPRVNTLVDGVARPFKAGSPASAFRSVWDVEAVEIGRGPQSTNTGRSSLSGAVNVSTRDPVHEREFAVRMGYFDQPGGRPHGQPAFD